MYFVLIISFIATFKIFNNIIMALINNQNTNQNGGNSITSIILPVIGCTFIVVFMIAINSWGSHPSISSMAKK